MEKLSPFLPTLGILAILVLLGTPVLFGFHPTTILSVIVFGSNMAWLVVKSMGMEEWSKCTLAMEIFSKLPTSASYVIGRKHFGPSAAAIPAAAMVTLAFLCVLIASIWSRTSKGKDGTR
jgi:hypothetical protein